MKIVGLTGGIGSGKTTVGKLFMELGIPVYIADIEAKTLMNEAEDLRGAIIRLLGEGAYEQGVLQRQYVASKVFTDKGLLSQLNAIVHPAVATHFRKWCEAQEAPYVLKEAAILFENEGYKACDSTILVTAPQETRILRVQKRDGSTRKEVLDRIKNQWSDERKQVLADFVINNEDLLKTKQFVKEIHKKIIS